MSQFYGMVVEEVQQLSAQFNRSADEIQQLVNTLTSKINSASWVGPDRDRFVNDWTSQHVPQLNAVMHALQNAGNLAQQNAQQQATASS